MQSIWRMRYFSSLMVLMLAGLRVSSAGYTQMSVFLTSVSSVPIFSIFSSLSTLVSRALSSLLWDLHIITYQSNWEMKYSVSYIGSPYILKKARPECLPSQRKVPSTGSRKVRTLNALNSTFQFRPCRSFYCNGHSFVFSVLVQFAFLWGKNSPGTIFFLFGPPCFFFLIDCPPILMNLKK